MDPGADEEMDPMSRDGRRKVQKKVREIDQWLSAMHIYGAVYLQQHPLEVAAFFKYLELVRGMAKQTSDFAWHIYDGTFRRARQCAPIP